MIEILPFTGTFPKRVAIPGSKYLANRALIISALARGDSRLFNVPKNNDIDTAIIGLKQFGANIFRHGTTVTVTGVKGHPTVPSSPIHTSASGTFSRFIVSLGSLLPEETRYYGSDKMNSRPMKDLLLALENLGVATTHNDFHLPLSIKGPLKGGTTTLNGAVSSQYLSSLLISGPFAPGAVVIEIEGNLVSKPYVKMTIDLMRHFGVVVDNHHDRRFVIRPRQSYMGQTFTIESDPVSSSYFLAAAALLGQSTTIPHFNVQGVQGESRFVHILKKMGCDIKTEPQSVTVQGPRQLKGIEVDMGDSPDVVQTLAVLAAFSQGTTHIKNISHLRHKESDRIGDTAGELRKLGAQVSQTTHSLTITGGSPLRGAVIETHDDHRLAMSFALAGLKVPDIKINHPEVVGKSFPSFWPTLSSCGVEWVSLP